MKVSEIDYTELSDKQIDAIVFGNVGDNNEICDYALVFGHVMLIKERTQKAVEMYDKNRVKKLVFLGGGYGDSNSSDDHVPESFQMRDLAVEMGVDINDIIVEGESTNTYENIINGLKILNDLNVRLDKIMLITSEFHLKRCESILKKINPDIETILVPVFDNINDRDKWFKTSDVWVINGKHGSGRTLVTNEAKILIDGAKKGVMVDFNIYLHKKVLQEKESANLTPGGRFL